MLVGKKWWIDRWDGHLVLWGGLLLLLKTDNSWAAAYYYLIIIILATKYSIDYSIAESSNRITKGFVLLKRNKVF